MATIVKASGFAVCVQATFGAKRSSVQLLAMSKSRGAPAKMSRAAFTLAMQSMPSFRSVMRTLVFQAFLEQVMVSVACNGAHSLVKQRLGALAAHDA